MRNFIRLLAATAVVLPLMAGCGDDDDDTNNTGGSSGTNNEGGDGGTGTSGSGGKSGSSTGGTKSDAGSGETPVGGSDGQAGAGGAGPVACDLDALEDGGTVPASGTLESGNYYLLEGIVKVSETLTIEPCVKILGDFGTVGTLVVEPGGQLIAEGTASAPIVFTSAKDPGDRLPGDWGGVLLLGNGVCNDAKDDALCEIEGLTDGTTFGNTPGDADDEESSGSLKYVRIEYAGVDLDGQGNEINGLTLGGVGSGTTISHVMVSNTLDDCFEWFGGAVNADHLIAYNCGDDMFDADAGFSGSVQFVFGKQGITLTSDPNGFEWDNDGTNVALSPKTTPNFANVTLCGTGSEEAGSGPENGMVLRRGVSGSITNALITGFFTAGLSARNTPDTDVTLTNSLVFGNGATFDATHDGGEDWLTDQTGNSEVAPENFGDCFGATPEPFPAEAIEGGEPTGQADESATYVGAFQNADDNWMTGAWVDWAAE
jgi:hypothetical protein